MIRAKLLFPLLVIMFILSLAVGVGRAYAQEPDPNPLAGAVGGLRTQCNIIYLLGEQLISCQSDDVKDLLTSAGEDPNQLDPHKCYNITLDGAIHEKDCTQPPFNFDWHYTTCADGTEVLVSGGQTDDQACLEDLVARGAPQCYRGNANGEYTEVTCDDAYRSELGGPTELGKCYLIDAASAGNVYKGPTTCSEIIKLVAESAANTSSNFNHPERQTCTTPDECLQDNQLIKFLKTAINVLSGVVGLVVTAMIVMGGIQYSSAGGNPNATAAAKKRIFNALLALVAYLFLFVILEWLLPGGLF